MNQQPSNRPFWLRFIAILLVALVVRIGAAYYWQGQQESSDSFAWGDSKTYWQIAENMTQFGDYSFGTPPKRIFRAPGYCGFLSLQMMASEAILGRPLRVIEARIAGCLLGVLAVAAVSLWAGQRSANRNVALLTAAGLAIYPGAIAMSIFVLSEALFMPVAVLALWTWDRALQETHLKNWLAWSVVSGLLSGQAVLIRPSWLLFPPFFALILLLFYRGRPKHFASAVTVGLMMAVAMLPWWYRNYQLTQRFVPTTLQVGASLYDGWNPAADGASDMTHGYEIEERIRANVATNPNYANLSADQLAMEQEMQANDGLRREAVDWGKAHRWDLTKLFFVKISRTWRPWPVAEQTGSWKMHVAVGVYMLLVVAFALPQIGRIRRSPTWLLMFMPTVYFTLLHGIFVGSIRYRQPAVFLLIPFAAFGMLSLMSKVGFKTGDSGAGSEDATEG